MPTDLPTKEEKKSENHAWWHPLAKGFISGTTAGYVCYPFEGWKKSKQSGLPLPRFWQLSSVYRGANAFALPLAPVSIVQVSINSKLLNLLPKNASENQQMAVGIVSGSLGALVSAPVEYIILTQRKHDIGPIDAIKKLTSKGFTHPWNALGPLMVREAGFGFTMLTGAEKVGNLLANYSDNEHVKNHLKTVGMVGTGITGAAITHPFDTMATRKQNSATPISMITAGKQLYQEGGFKAFFAGYRHRAALFTGCALIMNSLNKKFDEHVVYKKNSSTLFSKVNVVAEKETAEKKESSGYRPTI